MDTQNDTGYTVLMWASYWGHADVVKLLLEKGEYALDHINTETLSTFTIAHFFIKSILFNPTSSISDALKFPSRL